MAHIVRFQGGLGNQLFEYGLYLKFESLGKDTYADLWKYQGKGRGRDCRSFRLNELGIELREASKNDIKRLYCDEDNNLVRLWNYKVGTQWLKVIGKKNYFKEEHAKIDLSILETKEGYFSGFWQSELYFKDIKESIVSRIRFPEFSYSYKNLNNQIMKDDSSVSIHVRLTDYLEQSNRFGGICTSEYYTNAINYMKRVVDNPRFYVFSDDIEQARDLLGEFTDCIQYVEPTADSNDIDDLHLMSLCRNHIVANSTFSWWGAWIGDNIGKVVIAPTRWFADTEDNTIVPIGWITI